MLKSDAPIMVTIGAGDIGEMVGAIKKALDEKIFNWTNVRLILMFSLVIFLFRSLLSEMRSEK